MREKETFWVKINNYWCPLEVGKNKHGIILFVFFMFNGNTCLCKLAVSVSFALFCVLGVEPGVLALRSRYSDTELYPSPLPCCFLCWLLS